MNQSVAMGTRRPFFHNSNGNQLGSKDASTFNIAILGELGVGKSALTVKYITRRFIMEYDPTLEGTYDKQECVDGQDMLIRIMDTYDAEQSSPDRYLKWAHGFLVVYSITSRHSFEMARNYLESISKYLRITGKDRAIGLVGNKLDLERYRTVTKGEGLAVAGQYECQVHETSAAEDFGPVETVFRDLLREISRINERHQPLQNLYISEGESKTDQHSQFSQQGPSRSNRHLKTTKVNESSKATTGRTKPASPFKPMFPFGKQFTKLFN